MVSRDQICEHGEGLAATTCDQSDSVDAADEFREIAEVRLVGVVPVQLFAAQIVSAEHHQSLDISKYGEFTAVQESTRRATGLEQEQQRKEEIRVLFIRHVGIKKYTVACHYRLKKENLPEMFHQ